MMSMAGKMLTKKCSDAAIPDVEDYISLDCEFVGVGRNNISALGRFRLPLLSLSLMYVMSGSLCCA